MRALALALAVLTAVSAQGAEIEILPGNSSGPAFVMLQGEIISTDGARFAAATRGLDRAIVLLNSPGGRVFAGLEIGRTIRQRGYATAVLSPHECYSACALIWLGGANRYMTPDAVIGFHGAFQETERGTAVTGPGNAAIGAYLSEMGLNLEAILFATEAPPEDFLYLDPGRAMALGIDLIVTRGREGDMMVTLNDNPTAVDLARYQVRADFWQRECHGLLGKPTASVVGLGRGAAARAADYVTRGLWRDYVKAAEDDQLRLLAAVGRIAACLDTEDWFRAEGVATYIQPPSRGCPGQAGTAGAAICAAPELWAEEAARARLVAQIEARSDAALKASLETAEAAWQALLSACGEDIACLDAHFDLRLTMLARLAGL